MQVAGDLTMTQSHLTVLPRSSLAVDSSVFHIPSSGMGGYWHSWGVCFQGGAFDYNIHSIVDASVSVATVNVCPTTTQPHISRMFDWELFMYLMGAVIVGLSVITVYGPVDPDCKSRFGT